MLNSDMSIFGELHQRSYGFNTISDDALYSCVYKRIPSLLHEHELNLGRLNKVFASQWLSSREVVLGTKCNKVIKLDVITGQKIQIPSLKGRGPFVRQHINYSIGNAFFFHHPHSSSCGIHSIDINPSGTLLATGGDNPNEVAVYKLPNFEPVCVGENCHEDWIFDITWLDDEFLITGGRDGNLGLFQVTNDIQERAYRSDSQCFVSPHEKKQCQVSQKVRAIKFNRKTNDLGVLSPDGLFHIWNMHRFEESFTKRLDQCKENVCMSLSEDNSLYAVGSQSHVTFLDPRDLKTVFVISSSERDSGVRSLTFNKEVLTVGTGNGTILFYDIRNKAYLQCGCSGKPSTLKYRTGDGWLARDDMYAEFFFNEHFPNSVYTHCYNSARTKLFAAGGPLPSGLSGNYAALWQ
ncbi:DDB1- and CUL4-associated factor 12-like [Anneissia japonica]|uniref:DDB1- and CUL4-associated factor 12-like n=1 Tax=Anneissia japonica TaxID=1529436 RepID=UPI0014259E8F|nr:DDB1- and CUL4-associated factor 12-like [Anneissia japonica]